MTLKVSFLCSLRSLSLADCPVEDISLPAQNSSLTRLNVSNTAIKAWSEVEKFRQFPGLSELRILDCPFNSDLSAEERRSMIIARLPNIKVCFNTLNLYENLFSEQVLNGGDPIKEQERDEAERGFIRCFLDLPEEKRPQRFSELVDIHGNLDPLVKIDLTPEFFFHVRIYLSCTLSAPTFTYLLCCVTICYRNSYTN